jgi:glycerophosphoryl diester phosphodiesterase
MKFYKLLLICLVIAVASCKSNIEIQKEEKAKIASSSKIEVQGHRGERGYFPENSLPGFISAVNKGADVLELDVVISRDKKVVVSHEPYMSSLYMLTPAGDSIPKDREQSYNFYEMTYDSIKKFDAGSKGNRLFPAQKKMRTYKPLLSEVIDSVENYIKAHNLETVRYNIELKSVPSLYRIYQPQPEEFVTLVMQVIQEKGIEDKMNLQSFDPVILNVLRKKYPEIKVAYLVSAEGIQKNLALLDFKPEIYSPHYALIINEQFVDSIKALDMKLIPWTVNEKVNIDEMIKLKVDGIITDYPERVLEEL